jgi:hypothetical protein
VLRRLLAILLITPAAIAALGAAPAFANPSASPSAVDFGSVPVNTTVTRQVTITVDAGYQVELAQGDGLSPPFGFNFDSDPDGCSPGGTGFTGPGTCLVNETFTPTAAGTSHATTYVDECPTGGGQCIQAPFTDTGTGIVPQPTADVAPTSISFGNQGLNTTSGAQNVTITNNGTGPLHISGLTASGDFAAAGGSCTGATVGVGSSCTASVTFHPTATGLRTGSLTITDDAANSPQSVPLSGTGVQQTAVVSPGSLSFPDQVVGSSSSDQAVTLVNTGSVPVDISSITTSGDFAVSPSGGTCPASGSVPVGASCTVAVHFAPTAAGTRNGTLVIGDDSSTGPHVIALSGNGIAAVAGVQTAPSSLDFGTVRVGATGGTQTVTVTNPGTAPLTFSQISATGDYAVASSSTCGTGSVQPGHSCTVDVTFQPTHTGTRTGALVLSDNAPSNPQVVNLTGTGGPITLTTPDFSTNRSFIATVATITAGASSSVGHYVATINWGDGTTPTSGTLSPGAAAGNFAIGGYHSYASDGTHLVTIHVTGDDGSDVTSTSTITAKGAGLPCTATINSDAAPRGVAGDVTVPTQQLCSLHGVAVSGNVSSGTNSVLTLLGGSVTKSVTVNGSRWFALSGTSITGGLTVQGVSGTPTSGGLNSLCSASVGADVKVASNSAPIAIGDPAGCGANAGNQITGNLTVQNNVMPTGTTRSVLVSYNHIGKTLNCTGDKPPASGVTSSNTAAKKQGECTTL